MLDLPRTHIRVLHLSRRKLPAVNSS